MRLAGHGAPVRQLEIPLRAFERLDRRLFVDGEHDGVFGRCQVEPDDLGGLGRELGVVADAPGFAPGKVDLVCAQKAPDILDMHVAERPGDQRPGPVDVAARRRRIEQRQNAAAVRRAILGLRPAIAGFRKAGETVPRVTHAPFRCRAGRAAERAPNRPRRRAIGRHEHDLRLQARAMLRFGRTRQTLKLGALLGRQYDRRCCREAAHAALNHDWY